MQDVPDFYLTSYIVLLGVDGNGRQRRILVAAIQPVHLIHHAFNESYRLPRLPCHFQWPVHDTTPNHPKPRPHDSRDPWNPSYEPADSHWCSSRQSSPLFLRGFSRSRCRVMKTFVQR
ncbi:uncharacterized protein LACBIDRAFT_306721 [Laccaria bicolor S238N-H82]|uniref:Predicted protein n=1 Tax=Laccaria bicolor (strain S238N-H82 / ATCC MYA-4686) TaxID=486041 RepID=B0E4I2_LACBS|nr:uncharacterized protein LACBIDRAFT_306721 [Laccaria bicolor S238N-H82]EDQ98249.1 predicted protein [Laccaria bicolor S238N-H82]|eukprot:XP_001891100.1 predicted protein [Laccaria bicolor S238N-H82]